MGWSHSAPELWMRIDVGCGMASRIFAAYAPLACSARTTARACGRGRGGPGFAVQVSGRASGRRPDAALARAPMPILYAYSLCLFLFSRFSIVCSILYRMPYVYALLLLAPAAGGPTRRWPERAPSPQRGS